MNLQQDHHTGVQDSLNLRSVIHKIAYHWPLFLAGIVISLVIGYIYFRYTVRVYEVKAAIIIKDEKKDARYTILKELELADNNVVQEKEMELLKSKSLVGQTVHELGLYTRYILEGRVRQRDIYNDSPVFFKIISNPEVFYNREMSIINLGKERYTVKLTDNVQVQTGVGAIQKFKDGKWMLVKNPAFKTRLERNEIKISIDNPEVVTDRFQRNLNVGFTSKSKAVVGLGIKDVNPERGVDFLNKLIEVYNAASVNDKNLVARNTMAFLDERLNYLKQELSIVESELEQYKSSRGITDISSESQLFLESAKEKDTQLSQVNFKLQMLDDITRYVQNSSTTEPMPAIFGIDDAILQAQLTSFNVLLIERERMLATAGPKSPLLLIKEQQIQSARNAIIENLETLRKSYLASKNEISAQSSRIESSIRQIPRIEREFIGIKRQQTIKEQLYLFLLQKREEAGLTYASAVADSRMVDAANASNEPVSPRRGLVFQICLACGLGLPFLYIYFKDLLNTRIISRDDLKKIAHIPFLGEIGYTKSNTPIVIDSKSKSHVSEQFRVIRTNLQYVHGKETGKGRVTLITSSISGEGKSFFAANLAVALAITGRKVVLMEMDLRKPKLSQYIKINQETGITQYLVGLNSMNDIIKPSGIHPSLDFISSGPIPPNPSELLMSDSLDQLIEDIKNKYDDIIIDTAPIGLVADAQVLSRVANASIFVIRHGYSFKSEVNNIEQIHHESKLPRIGIVFNGVNTGGRYGYGYIIGKEEKYGYYQNSMDKSGAFNKIKELIRRF